MLKRFLLLGMAGTLVILTSCIFDPDKDETKDPPKPIEWPNNDTREEVLETLELSYNNRKIDKYEAILDQNFTMFFSSGDVSGGITPEQWGRADEVSANRNLFNPAYNDPDGQQARCLKITLDVQWEDGVVWQAINPSSAPEETWYTGTVFYNFQFDIEPDLHLINNPSSKAQFTVRNEGTDEAPLWKLVEFRDLDGEI